MPRRRCRHTSLTDPLKPSAECCENCVSWTDTNAALPRGETEQFSIFRWKKIYRQVLRVSVLPGKRRPISHLPAPSMTATGDGENCNHVEWRAGHAGPCRGRPGNRPPTVACGGAPLFFFFGGCVDPRP